MIRFELEGWTIPVLYIGMEVITVIAALQFMDAGSGHALDPRQAKRLFPHDRWRRLVCSYAGRFTIETAHESLRLAKTLLWLVLGLLVAVSVVSAVTTRLPRAPVPQLPARPGVRTRRKPLGPYLRAIALLVVSAAVVATVIDYRVQIISSSTLAKEKISSDSLGNSMRLPDFSTLRSCNLFLPGYCSAAFLAS